MNRGLAITNFNLALVFDSLLQKNPKNLQHLDKMKFSKPNARSYIFNISFQIFWRKVIQKVNIVNQLYEIASVTIVRILHNTEWIIWTIGGRKRKLKILPDITSASLEWALQLSCNSTQFCSPQACLYFFKWPLNKGRKIHPSIFRILLGAK